MVLLAVTYALFAIIIVAGISNEGVERLAIALSILSAFGTIAIPLMNKLMKISS